MSVQNPTIPSPVDARGIDAVILDLQTILDGNLTWLTNGMGRAYRLTKVRANQSVVFLPEVYLGTDQYKYFAATPDNDKTGQSIFITDTTTYPSQQLGFYGWKQFDLSIIFSANLELINSPLLLTDDFTEHLMIDVEEILLRLLLGKNYKLTINSSTRQFEDVYAEFDVTEDRGIAHAPMTHFRFNCTVLLREDCPTPSFDVCTALQQNFSQADLLCACGTVGTANSMLFDGVNENIEYGTTTAFDFQSTDSFTFSAWVKINSFNNGHIITKYQSSAMPTGVFMSAFTGGVIRFDMQSNTSGGFNILSARTLPVLTIGQWNHVMVTYDGSLSGSGVEFYVNGLQQTKIIVLDTLVGNISNAATVELGGDSTSGLYMDGYMYEARIWNTELNATQALAEATLDPTTGLAPNPQLTGNLIVRNQTGGGSEAIFGSSEWNFANNTTVTTAATSNNMEEGDRTTDLP